MSGLPDVLDYYMKIIFCGTGAGKRSGEPGHYYTEKGNLFRKTLYDVKLTKYQLKPSDYQKVKKFGIGLTDMTKAKPGPDADRKKTDYDPERFEEVISKWKPKCMAFNGKAAADLAFQDKVTYGQHKLKEIPAFVLPSTSAMAKSYWDIKYGKELCDLVKN